MRSCKFENPCSKQFAPTHNWNFTTGIAACKAPINVPGDTVIRHQNSLNPIDPARFFGVSRC